MELNTPKLKESLLGNDRDSNGVAEVITAVNLRNTRKAVICFRCAYEHFTLEYIREIGKYVCCTN